MNEEHTAKVLDAHAEGVAGQPEVIQQVNMMDEELGRLTTLFQLAEQLQQSMQPVQPSTAFVRSLGRELVENAKRQIVLAKRLRRAVMIGAAALGSLVSIASVVGAIAFVIARLRARAQAQTAQVPTG
jgi:hypothetical protein